MDPAAAFTFEAPPEAVAAFSVSATNATYLPEALIDGATEASPESFPASSVETICVFGVQEPFAPLQVSRT
jgi:hypothetical protein